MKLEPTASQTVGPYHHIGLCWFAADRIALPDCPGEHVTVRGRVLDADGSGVNDALVEIWQADYTGKYAHPEDTRDVVITPGFRGFGRVPTDAAGQFQFHTIKPGPAPDIDDGLQAPHLMISIFMRGLLKQIRTRMYFPCEPLNAEDRVLRLVPAERRGTLLARQVSAGALEWNIHLQGPDEIVIFDC